MLHLFTTRRAMLIPSLLLCLLAGRAFAANAAPTTRPAGVKVRIVLVGDSTVAEKSGWGPGFAERLTPAAQSINHAAGGRSSKSFIDEGRWQKALADKPDYVLIQFGHNDMPGKGPARETSPASTYPQFLARCIDDARAAGIQPILLTSLVRRRFNAEGKIESDLTAYTEAAKKVAADKKVPLIDLHALSIELHNKLGPAATAPLEPPGKTPNTLDHTHLNSKGAEVFGTLVADELKKVVPALAPYIK